MHQTYSNVERTHDSGPNETGTDENFAVSIDMSPNFPHPDTLSCEQLLSLGPNKAGYCLKRNNSLLAYWFPWFFARWKNRFLVLLGNYLYRFESNVGEHVKGVPIPLDTLSISKLEGSELEFITIRKIYVLRFGSELEASEWMEAIRLRKLQAVKESLGHAKVKLEIKRIDALSERIFSKRLKIDKLLAEETGNPFHAVDSTFH